MGIFKSIAKAVAGPLVGAASSAFGSYRQNREARAAADRQMAFQERTIRNRYQWTMEDMRKAGLNPILAYQQGGGPAAGGASYTPQNVGASAPEAVSSARQSIMARKQLQLLDAQIKNVAQDTTKKSAEVNTIDTQGALNVQNWRIGQETIATAKAAAAQARTAEEFWKTDVGKKMKQIDLFFRSLNPMVSAGSSAKSIAR